MVHDLFAWAEDSSLITSDPDSLGGVYDAENENKEFVYFGQATNGISDLCIMPISWWSLGGSSTIEERERFDIEFDAVANQLKPLLGKNGNSKTDKEWHNYRSICWKVNGGVIYLYQDERDPQFGAELAISVLKYESPSMWSLE